MKRRIITVNDGDEAKILHILAQRVSDREEEKRILKDLEDSLPDNGIGLAATQIGINKRAFIIRFEGKIIPFVNPRIIISPADLETELDEEGCLSVPGKTFIVPRYKSITVENNPRYKTEQWESHVNPEMARVVLHEFYHLAGITIDQIGKEV